MDIGIAELETETFALDVARSRMLCALNDLLRHRGVSDAVKRQEVAATISAVRQLGALAGVLNGE